MTREREALEVIRTALELVAHHRNVGGPFTLISASIIDDAKHALQAVTLLAATKPAEAFAVLAAAGTTRAIFQGQETVRALQELDSIRQRCAALEGALEAAYEWAAGYPLQGERSTADYAAAEHVYVLARAALARPATPTEAGG